jgi:hypothetical protein
MPGGRLETRLTILKRRRAARRLLSALADRAAVPTLMRPCMAQDHQRQQPNPIRYNMFPLR